MKYINLLIKPASSLCNLRCKYCFYEDEANNRSEACMGLMSKEMSQLLLREAFSAVDSNGTVSFAFQGGEPTVAGLTFFQEFVENARLLKPKDVSLNFSIQTNGTLLNEEWAAFFEKEGFLVGLSMDGFKEAHDLHRMDPAGKGSWNRVLKAHQLLEKHRVDHNALCVVTSRVARSPELAYCNLKSLGFRYLQFIACLDPIGQPRGQQAFSLVPEAYGKFLCRLFDLWYADWEKGDYHSVRLFDDYIHVLLGDGASTCATCGRCGFYLVVEGDGSLYPCDFFVLDDWRLGKLGEKPLQEFAESETAKTFLQWGTVKPKECAACPYCTICNGGCKNDWYTDAEGKVHNYYCAAFRALLDHGLPRMRRIAWAELNARMQRR
jgi:uncharacterized protein